MKQSSPFLPFKPVALAILLAGGVSAVHAQSTPVFQSIASDPINALGSLTGVYGSVSSQYAGTALFANASNSIGPSQYGAYVSVVGNGGQDIASPYHNVTIAAGANSLVVSGAGVTVNGTALLGAADLESYAKLSGADFTGNVGVAGTATTNGIANSGDISTTTLSTTGQAKLDSAVVTNNAIVGGTLGVNGASTFSSATVNSSLTVKGNTTITGATNINTTGSADTALGNSDTESLVTLRGGKSMVSVSDNRINITSGNSGVFVADNSASLYSTSGDSATGFGTSSQPQLVGSQGAALLSNGNAASQALVSGALVNNIIKGNTLVDGNMYINGTLVYSSNTSASTTVTGTGTVGSMNIVNAGQTGAVVDGNGKITSGTTNQATASLTVTNALGNTHGVVVQENSTTISGGANSTSLSLNDNGARFSNAATGAPVTVTGVANGSGDFDAVNVRQFAGAIASASAMANIPGVDTNKDASVGVGMGNFMGRSALAFGGSYRISSNGVLKASLATGLSSGGSKTNVGFGAGWSW